jgi:hypothetical protein
MQPKMKTTSWFLAVGATAILAVAGVARAGTPPNSGGPGALGTEVPFDSRLARDYFNYYLPTDTPEAIGIRDDVQKLHASHQAVVALARTAVQAPAVRALAQRLSDEQARIDGSLVDVARDSLLGLSGAAYDEEVRADAATQRDVETATGSGRDSRFVAAAVQLLEGQLANVEQLQPRARKALRQQLGSVLAREKKLLQGELDAAQALASKVAAREPRGG